MIFKYVLFTVVNLLFTALAYILSPLVALFCKDDGYLPNWLAWFQTFDAPLDAGVNDKYPGFDPADSKWWNRTKWLWRNPAYGFCYWAIGIPFDPTQWVVDSYVKNADGTASFKAHSIDGKYFNIMTATGTKLGWKAWNYFLGLDADGKPQWKTAPWGPEWRTPICFTPSIKGIKALFTK